MQVKFEFAIDDIVCYKQVSKDDNDVDVSWRGKEEVKYRVISRIYEEVVPKSKGLKSYAVRHLNSAVPGSGEIYKFSERELIKYSTLVSLRKLVEPQQYKDDEFIPTGLRLPFQGVATLYHPDIIKYTG